MKTRRTRNSERGAVIVMVAVWLPVLALFASFAIDVAWLVRRRHLPLETTP